MLDGTKRSKPTLMKSMTNGLPERAEAGNIKAAARKIIVQWILDSQILKDIIQKSFKTYALNLSTDGSEDHQIHCLKEGTICTAGAERLKNQFKVIES